MQTHIAQVVEKKNKSNIGSKEEDMTYCLRCRETTDVEKQQIKMC